MKIVYTSGLGVQGADKRLRDENGFVDMLRITLPEMNKLVIISNNWESEKPVGLSLNDEFDDAKITNFEFAKRIKAWYKASNIDFKEVVLIDENYNGNLKKDVETSDMIIVENGNTLKSLKNLERISLKEKLKDYRGVLLVPGSSAKIPAIKVSYGVLDGEEDFQDEEGLGLVDYAVRPYFNYSLKWKFDKQGRNSLKLIKEISKTQTVFAIDFDSYIVDDGSNVVVYGKCYSFKNGKIKKECSDDKYQVLR